MCLSEYDIEKSSDEKYNKKQINKNTRRNY